MGLYLGIFVLELSTVGRYDPPEVVPLSNLFGRYSFATHLQYLDNVELMLQATEKGGLKSQ